jgi:aspartate/methionine/tyrosine aminotransferase
MFSARAGFFGGIPNILYRAKDALTKAGTPFTDLISGNVNAQGIHYPPSLLKKALQTTSQTKIYRPDPQGQPVARRAVQKYYEGEGVVIPADQMIMTPGTSVAYAYLFQLLANPGDEILCPTPTYPLFDAIAALCDVKLVSYRLVPKDRWTMDCDDLKNKITQKTRAIVLISPHNPTGAVASELEIQQLGQIAREHRLPIIADEVFAPFLFNVKKLPRPAETDAPLVFTLNGISKMLALPGLKIGWIAVSGEPPLVKKALGVLRGISDTFLPVNEPIQFALPALLDEGKPFMEEYRSRILYRKEIAVALLSKAGGLSFITPEGGFYMTLQMTDFKSNDEKVAVHLLQKEGIFVHPGYFYDLPPRSLVFSFVLQPVRLKKTLARFIHYFNQPITREDHHERA